MTENNNKDIILSLSPEIKEKATRLLQQDFDRISDNLDVVCSKLFQSLSDTVNSLDDNHEGNIIVKLEKPVSLSAFSYFKVLLSRQGYEVIYESHHYDEYIDTLDGVPIYYSDLVFAFGIVLPSSTGGTIEEEDEVVSTEKRSFFSPILLSVSKKAPVSKLRFTIVFLRTVVTLAVPVILYNLFAFLFDLVPQVLMGIPLSEVYFDSYISYGTYLYTLATFIVAFLVGYVETKDELFKIK